MIIICILQLKKPQPRDTLNNMAKITLLRNGRDGVQTRQGCSRTNSEPPSPHISLPKGKHAAEQKKEKPSQRQEDETPREEAESPGERAGRAGYAGRAGQ